METPLQLTDYNKYNPMYPSINKKVIERNTHYEDGALGVRQFLKESKLECRLDSAKPTIFLILKFGIKLYETGTWFAPNHNLTGSNVNSLVEMLEVIKPEYYNFEKLKMFFIEGKPMYHSNEESYVSYYDDVITLHRSYGTADITPSEFLEWFSQSPKDFKFKEQLEHKNSTAYQFLEELEIK